jgi:ABC-type Fe3+-hydroxamate transport system substrate-binding protein
VTEILYFAGLGPKVVAVTNNCDYPSKVSALPRVGEYTRINAEAVMKYAPDVVIATSAGNEKTDILKLRRFGIPVYVTDFHDVSSVITSIRRLGKMFGSNLETEIALARLETRKDKILKRVDHSKAAPRTLFLLEIEPVFVVGSGIESIVKRKPDVIVTSQTAFGPELIQQKWKRWKKAIPALANNRICVLEQDEVSRPGPRIVNALEQLVACISGKQELFHE